MSGRIVIESGRFWARSESGALRPVHLTSRQLAQLRQPACRSQAEGRKAHEVELRE